MSKPAPMVRTLADTEVPALQRVAVADLVRLTENTPGVWLVVFGHRRKDGSFAVAHSKPSRTFRTLAGAQRAAARWVAGGAA